jgi:hypothetical protein
MIISAKTLRNVSLSASLALLFLSLLLPIPPAQAQIDSNKTILEQLNEYGADYQKREEERKAREKKAQEEREAKLREREKLSPEQRQELDCKELESTDFAGKCRGHYFRLGYKDTWRGAVGHDIVVVVIMEGPQGAVMCADRQLTNVTPCYPLKRAE